MESGEVFLARLQIAVIVRIEGRTVDVIVVARGALPIDIDCRLGMPATLVGVASLRTDGNLGTIRYVAEDGGDEFGVGDLRNSGFTTFSTFGRWCSRRFRGDKPMPSLQQKWMDRVEQGQQGKVNQGDQRRASARVLHYHLT